MAFEIGVGFKIGDIDFGWIWKSRAGVGGAFCPSIGDFFGARNFDFATVALVSDGLGGGAGVFCGKVDGFVLFVGAGLDVDYDRFGELFAGFQSADIISGFLNCGKWLGFCAITSGVIAGGGNIQIYIVGG